jgi:hypothetical protein
MSTARAVDQHQISVRDWLIGAIVFDLAHPLRRRRRGSARMDRRNRTRTVDLIAGEARISIDREHG